MKSGIKNINTKTETKLPTRCPRCGGNIFWDEDHDGWYFECLQCSHRQDVVLQLGVPKKRR